MPRDYGSNQPGGSARSVHTPSETTTAPTPKGVGVQPSGKDESGNFHSLLRSGSGEFEQFTLEGYVRVLRRTGKLLYVVYEYVVHVSDADEAEWLGDNVKPALDALIHLPNP